MSSGSTEGANTLSNSIIYGFQREVKCNCNDIKGAKKTKSFIEKISPLI
jgi:hypothetical protein